MVVLNCVRSQELKADMEDARERMEVEAKAEEEREGQEEEHYLGGAGGGGEGEAEKEVERRGKPHVENRTHHTGL
jgi:hypothetical protein